MSTTAGVPDVAELLQRVPALPENGRALLSLVAVDDLARLLATLARATRAIPLGTVHHAAHPHPPILREFVALLGETLGLPVPQHGLALDDYLTRLHTTPGKVSAHQAERGSPPAPKGADATDAVSEVTAPPDVFHVKHSRGAEDPQVSRPTP
ncbi:hypothetical protein ACWDBW_12505 [Streptomyces sp. NPDC001107]